MEMDNFVRLTGRLGRDPELQYTKNGRPMVRMLLAVDRYQGRDKEKGTDWFRVVLWAKQAENAVKYLQKGSKVTVQGRLRGTFFEAAGADGQTRNRLDIEVIGDQVQYWSRPTATAAPSPSSGKGK